MLYINDLEGCAFEMFGGSPSAKAGQKVLSKKGVCAKAMEAVYNEKGSRIGIWDGEREIWLLQHRLLPEITLDSVVYTDAAEFVKAFDAMTGCCDSGGGGGNGGSAEDCDDCILVEDGTTYIITE